MKADGQAFEKLKYPQVQKGKCKYLWKSVSSGLIEVRMRGNHVNMAILQCYSPTNDKEDEVKDLFYKQLQLEVEIASWHDMLVVMGDQNSKFGSDNSRNEVMEKHECDLMNENGVKLLEFCYTNKLTVGGILFPRRDIHKLTWYSPIIQIRTRSIIY